jgi:hypothetical protein
MRLEDMVAVNQPGCRILFCLLFAAACTPSFAINILINYDYDTNDFFLNNQARKDALQAAANRYSAIITTSLTSESLLNNNTDPRIGFPHPGTGEDFEVSSATNTGNDRLVTLLGVAPADEYRGPWSITADQWILYAGGRPLSGNTVGVGGTATGTNFENLFSDESSHLTRGFRTVSDVNSLPVWGGSISFDTSNRTWHTNLSTPAPAGTTDLYSIALHEIGHALGLSTQWLDWTNETDGAAHFTGTNAVAAYNVDNNASLTSLDEVGGTPPNDDHHWKDDTYNSRIFHNGNPIYVGTVGAGNLQDLIMEPGASFTGSITRFELTNVDVAALRDIGWSTIPQIDAPLSLAGDYNSDGEVDAADYVRWRKVNSVGTYATWRQNFGESSGAGAGGFVVPEPAISTSLLFMCFAGYLANRRPRN